MVDSSGNVYVTGFSYGNDYDYVTIKYYPNGDTAWLRRYSYWDDYASALAVDGSGNVYVTGHTYRGATQFDYTTVKYDFKGDTAWVRTYNGPANYEDTPVDIAVDGLGNVYVTGNTYTYGCATIKYWQNYPPNTFSLIHPSESATCPCNVVLNWEAARDPDPWDTVKYDLYLSRSVIFNPDSTTFYDSLLDTTFTDSLGPKTWHWKVRAYDRRGATRWSDQTWSFYVNSRPDAYSLITPTDADSIKTEVQFKWRQAIDPDNDTVHYDLYLSPSIVFAPESTIVYNRLLDTTFVDSLGPKMWYWKVKAYDKWGDERWSDQTLSFYVYLTGDANIDTKVTVSDVVYLINFLFKGGPAPKPYRAGEVNCDGYVTVADVVYLVNYLFKGGPPPAC